MKLAAGARLGPYEIVAPIGAGGMGEVWRARDTRLDRSVAIKILPGSFAADGQRRARFEREARAISQLSHPRICALYDVGTHEGCAYLVMEYLEGVTLAERIDRGPMPVDQVIRIGAEICEALDRAHSAGVIHRDLKPANVMLVHGGVKLLDFGLAKQAAPKVDSDSPTVAHADLTADGAILGTLMYMAPEQLRGEPLDARADIFALGALLYEMASGRRAFRGTSHATAVAAILHEEPPPLETLVPHLPPAFCEVVGRALAKDRDQRWNCARDLSYELTRAPRVVTAPAGPRRRPWLPWTLAGAAAIVAAVSIAVAVRSRAGRSAFPIRFSFRPPANAVLAFNEVAMPLALSPDGKSLAYTAWVEGRLSILLRSLDSTESRVIPAAAGGAWPFWSPDGKWIGFFSDGVMKRVPAAGGPAEIMVPNARGGSASWSRDGEIIFHEFGPETPDEIEFVTAAGSGRSEATHAPGRWSIWPSFLPDGKHFLFSRASNMGGEGGIYAGELGVPGQTSVVLASGSSPRYANGSLFYVDGGRLQRQPFNSRTLQTSGDAVAVADNVYNFRPTGSAAFTISEDGNTVAFEHGPAPARLMVMGKTGSVRGQLGPEGDYRSFHVARDGMSVVVTKVDPSSGIPNAWIIDVRRNVIAPITHEQAGVFSALPSPDGKLLAITRSSSVSAAPNIHLAPIGRSSQARPILPLLGAQISTSWSPDGQRLLVTTDSGANADIVVAKIGPALATSGPERFAASRFNEREAVFSPDGKWVAYVSDESGKAEVYCASFGSESERVQISTAGGSEPRWSIDGSELFYIGGDRRLVSVPITPGATLGVGVPVPLFPIECAAARHFEIFAQQCYDVVPDGNFIVLTRDDDDPSGTIVVIRQ